MPSINQTSGIQNLDQRSYFEERVCFPPALEQVAISAFLDRETAKIDALIDKQEQLVATLREDRTATITHAVTKGLNPDIEMKDSGVEWIAKSPNHWKTSRVKHAANILTGFPFKSDGFLDHLDQMRLLRGANVGVVSINWTDVVYWPRAESPSFAEYALEVGDIVIGLDRPFIGSGIRVALTGQADVPSLLLQRVARLRASSDFDQKYIFYLMISPAIIHHLTPVFTGVSVPHVSPEQVGSMPIPQPPLDEQNRIATFLDEQWTRIDLLIAKATEMIATLREYRSALITAAVTGKIDVREASA